MTDAAEDLERLLVVQDLDTALSQLQHRRYTLAQTSGLADLEGEVARLEAARTDAEGRRAVLRATQEDLEGQIAALNERRDVVEKRMYAATGSSARDLQAMSDEVQHLAGRRAELEELELAAMLEQDPVDAELAALREQTAPLEVRVGQLRTEVEGERGAIDRELAELAGRRSSEAALVPSALADRYETLRTHLRGTGAARLVGNRCSGCHLELSSVEVERIRALPPGDVVTCEQCGRILVPV